MGLRIAVGGIIHETNTYCRGTTPLSAFQIDRGEALLALATRTRTHLGGMIDAAAALGATLIPTLVAETRPSGTIAHEAYEALAGELLTQIEAALPLDAVALTLHGAAVAEGIDDMDGHLCQQIRSLVGPGVKIAITLDLHGNITQAMADAVEIALGHHYYPHTDSYERGREAIYLLDRVIRGELQPVAHVEWLPLLLPASTTEHGPARAVLERCRQVEERPGVIDCTFFHGFPYTDVPVVGAQIICTVDGDPDLAQRYAQEVASYLWSLREAFRPTSLTPAEAIAAALQVAGGPVIINDTADNPGGGGPGDGTHLLRAMLDANLDHACFAFLCDPESAAQAHDAGVGAIVRFRLGGKYDDFHGAPIEVEGYVKSLTDGRFTLQAMEAGLPQHLGKMARLQVGAVDLLVGSHRAQVFDPEIFLLHGIDVTRYKIVAVKSSHHFRAGFAPLARAIITADSPGLTTHRVEYFPRERTPRPIWPLDPDATYP